MEKVEVLLSVYNPNIPYLIKQLESIDNQDYENLELLVFDDCVHNRLDVSVLEHTMKKKKYRILPYKEVNLGYVKAFEELVANSESTYCAFCDQDDIWMPNKISVCVDALRKGLSLVSSDKQIIDECDRVICQSFDATREQPFKLPRTNEQLGKSNFFGTFADGLTLVADTAFAKRCIPFSESTGHDKWLIACACAENSFHNIETALVQYRRHSNNVSGFMKGINNKIDYLEQRVLPNSRVIAQFSQKYPACPYLQEVHAFSEARIHHRFLELLKYRKISPKVAAFDMMLCFAPNWVFVIAIKFLRKRYGRL